MWMSLTDPVGEPYSQSVSTTRFLGGQTVWQVSSPRTLSESLASL